MKFVTTYILFFCIVFAISAQPFKQISPNPPMGWNSWNYFGKNDINENLMKKCMDAIVKNGLRDAGYTYFLIDGGWRDSVLNEDGTLRSHPVKFPNGMKALADYAHSKGLKFGLHTVPGTHDCGGDAVGAYGIEEVHIQQFIDWGLDFVKVDRCRLMTGCADKSCWDEDQIEATYRRWRSILDAKNSSILLSISAYDYREWNPDVCNMSRTTGDISCRVTGGTFFSDEEKVKGKGQHSVLSIADKNNESAAFAGKGYWNDPDMLVTGDNGLTFEEQQTHFALWCIMSAPLLLGNDPRHIWNQEKSIILNKQAIEINQDPTEQGKKMGHSNGIDYWKKNLKDGSCAVLVFNRTLSKTIRLNLDWEQLQLAQPTSVFDVYGQQQLEQAREVNVLLKPHQCKFLLVN